MLKGLMLCASHSIYLEVCRMYGFNAAEIVYAHNWERLQGVSRGMPIWVYTSAGYTQELRETISFAETRFNNINYLREVNGL